MAYIVTFHCAHPESIRKHLHSIAGIEVFPGCWIARHDGSADDLATRLTPFMNREDGLFVTRAGEHAAWHSLRVQDTHVRAALNDSV